MAGGPLVLYTDLRPTEWPLDETVLGLEVRAKIGGRRRSVGVVCARIESRGMTPRLMWWACHPDARSGVGPYADHRTAALELVRRAREP